MRKLWWSCWIVALAAGTPRLPAQVVLNEILANNGGGVSGPDGGSYDFVELFNRGGTDVSLGGWSIRVIEGDKTNTFAFAATNVVRSQSPMVVWFNAKTNTPAPRATFGLSRTAGRVDLVNTGSIADTVSYGMQAEDLSIGRVPNATGEWLLNYPTPTNLNLRVPVASVGTPLALRLNEWLPTNSAGADRDWLEIHNPKSNGPVVLTGNIISDQVNVAAISGPALPPLSFLHGGGFLRFWCDDKTNSGPDHLPFKLSSSDGETLTIYAENRTIIDRISFGSYTALTSRGRDVSMGRLPDGGSNIVYFPGTNYITPGDANMYLPMTNVFVAEILSHTDPPFEDAIKLFNPGTTEVDLGGWWVSNDPDRPAKWRIPAGTRIAAQAYKVIYEQIPPSAAGSGFNTSGSGSFPDFTINSAAGDNVVFTAFLPIPTLNNMPGAYRVVRDIPSAENGVSWGRYIKSDGGSDFVPLSRVSTGVAQPGNIAQFRQGTGVANAAPKIGPLVISEIMYHPPDIIAGGVTNDNSLDEYVELTSITNGVLRLYFFDGTGEFPPFYAATNTYRLRGSIDYDFPQGVELQPFERILVLNFDPATNVTETAAFRTKYNIPGDIRLFGPYGGKLANGSDVLELRKPDRVQGNQHPDAGYVPYIMVEKVRYEDKAPWPTNRVDGGGYALQRLVLTDFSNDQINWFGDIPTPGRDNIILRPPTVLAQPASKSVNRGSPASISLSVTGTPPFFFQWYQNGTPLASGANPSVLTSNLLFASAQPSNAGAFRVVISNAVGAVTSAVANLTVISEKVRPTVAIAFPAANARLSNDTTWVRGTAADAKGVVLVRWQVNGGEWFDATGTTKWSNSVPLEPGTNVVRVYSVDTSDNISLTNSRVLFRVVPASLIVVTNGRGSVTPKLGAVLDARRGYRLTAAPAAGWLFRNWSTQLGYLTSTPVLNFIMEPGLVLYANFVTNHYAALKGTFNGLFHEDDAVRQDRSGFITFNLTDRGAASGKILLGGATHSFSTTFNVEGEATARINRAGKTPLTLVLQMDVFGGSETVGGSLGDGNWVARVTGDRMVGTTASPSFARGYFTMVLPGYAFDPFADPAVPGGHGFGTATVTPLGVLTFKGTLADGTVVSQTSGVSRDGDWPLFISLYGGKGTLLGWLRFNRGSPTYLSGQVNWLKGTNVTTVKMYPEGFATTLQPRGWAYTAPTNVPIFTFASGEFALAGGGLVQSPSTNFVLSVSNTRIEIDPFDQFESEITPTLKLDLKTGFLTGAFRNPVTASNTPLKGIVLRPENRGFGMFLSTNASGAFLFQQSATESD